MQVETQSVQAFKLNFLEGSAGDANIMKEMPKETTLHFEAPSTTEESYTWNAIGMLRGSDPALRHSAVLLSAQLDPLGVGTPVNGAATSNGAADDASGSTAAPSLACCLGTGP